jgi:hypothetical protein
MLSSTWDSNAPNRLERTRTHGGSPGGALSGHGGDQALSSSDAPRTLTSRDLYNEVRRRLKLKGYAWE